MAEKTISNAGKIALIILAGAGIVAFIYRDQIKAWFDSILNPTPTDKHYECVNGKCVLVDGAGTSTCSKDADCVVIPPNYVGVVHGTIISNIDFKPMQGVQITVSGQNTGVSFSAVTDGFGNYSISLTRYDSYVFTASKTGYPAVNGYFTLTQSSNNIEINANMG